MEVGREDLQADMGTSAGQRRSGVLEACSVSGAGHCLGVCTGWKVISRHEAG